VNRYDHRAMEDLDRVARRIVTDLQPESVLDAGCGNGVLVEYLRALGVDAYGIDESGQASDAVPASVREYVRRGSLTEPLERKYDLVVSVEVLEHLDSSDAEQAIESMCAATDRVLFSSTPYDYAEPTHVNVHAPEDWSAQFARQGFVRNIDFDGAFVTPWTTLYERSHALLPEVVRSYDRAWWQLRTEVRQVRQKVLELHAQVGAGAGPVAEENRRLREELLVARDDIVGHEARLGEALGRIEVLEAELRRHEAAAAEARQLLDSRTGRLLRAWHRLRALLQR
jgi:SAM-dependent methyltransferase